VRNRGLIGIGIIVALVIIALLAAPAFINVNRYRPQIEAQLKNRLGRDVSLGPMRLSLIPTAFRVDNVVVSEDPQFNSGHPFAQIQTLFVRPRLLPLLHHNVEIKSLQLGRPSLEFVRNAQGKWNFESLIRDNPSQKPGEFSLDQLRIDDGQIAVTDQQQQKPRSVYDHIDVVLSDFAPDRAFNLDAHAHLPGTGHEILDLQGKIGPLRRDALAQSPLDASLKLDSVTLSALQRFLNTQALADSDAVITGNATLKNNAGDVDSKGSFVMNNPRIRGVNVGYPIGIDYQVDGDLSRSTATIHKANLKLGQTPVSINGTINAQPTPAQIDVTVQASNASVSEAARLAAAFGAAFNAKTNVSGTVDLNVHAQGAITRPAMNGQLAARKINISGGELREPVELDAIDLALSPEAIRSNEFTAKTGHTSAAGQFTVTGYTTDAPRIEAKLNTNNADIQELLRIGQAYGVSSLDGVSGSGLLTLNVDVSGPVKDAGQLVFNGSGALRNASIQAPSVARPISVAKADMQFSGNGVTMNDADVSIGQTSAHGNFVLTNFAAPHVQFGLTANRINVAEWEQLFKMTGPANKPSPSHQTAANKTNGEAAMSRVTGTGSLTVDSLVYDDLTLKNVKSNVNLDHGVITLDPLTADLYNGQETGKVVVNTQTTPATYTVDSRLQGVDANQLLSSISPVKQTVYGVLSANADTHFTTAAGAPSILPSLTGKVSLGLKNGKIANVDLLHQLATIAQFTRTAQAVEPFTQLVQLTGDFDINHGVAHTNDLKATMDAGSLAADGIVDLAQQRLNMRLTAVLSQSYSQSVGGTNIGGFLNTALANTGGELVIPVTVTGTFQDPHFAPDLQRVADMKLKNILPGLENPSALTKGFLGQVLRGKPGIPDQPSQPGQPAPAQNPVQNLFDIFQKPKK